MSLVSASIVVCERILTEQDGVSSLIRAIDLFLVSPVPNVPSDDQGVQVGAFGTFRLSAGDTAAHDVELRLLRPDGHPVLVWHERGKVFLPKANGGLGGLNLVVNLGINAAHLGMHLLELLVDDEVVAKATLTLALRQPDSAR